MRLRGWKSQSEKADDARVEGVGVWRGQMGRRRVRLACDTVVVQSEWGELRAVGRESRNTKRQCQRRRLRMAEGGNVGDGHERALTGVA